MSSCCCCQRSSGAVPAERPDFAPICFNRRREPETEVVGSELTTPGAAGLAPGTGHRGRPGRGSAGVASVHAIAVPTAGVNSRIRWVVSPVRSSVRRSPRIRWVVSPVRSSVRRSPRKRWVVSPVRSSVSRLVTMFLSSDSWASGRSPPPGLRRPCDSHVRRERRARVTLDAASWERATVAAKVALSAPVEI